MTSREFKHQLQLIRINSRDDVERNAERLNLIEDALLDLLEKEE